MITVLASPKPWIGRVAKIQEKAIQSWKHIHPDVEIILYGNSPGTAVACQKFGICHIPNIEANENEIPFFGAIVDHAAKHAKYDTQAYVNCDILLTPHILNAIKSIHFSDFLMIGQRIDLSEWVAIETVDPDLINKLIALSQSGGINLHLPAGSDYFMFKRGMWHDLPPVVIGRGGYDGALIASCLQRCIPVVDATLSILALHQFHDYEHVSGGDNEIFYGKEAQQNLNLNSVQNGLSLLDAQWRFNGSVLKRTWSRGDWPRAIETSLRIRKKTIFADTFRPIRRLVYKFGLLHCMEITLSYLLESFQKDMANGNH